MEHATGRAAVETWLARVKPELQPLARRLDRLILDRMPGATCQVKWNVPFYGVPGLGWVAAMNSFKAHVKLLFFAGQNLRPMPPAGKGHNAIDLRSEEELDEKQITSWLDQAKKLPGWALKTFPGQGENDAKPKALKMNPTNPKVDAYLTKAKKWREEMEKLRAIIREAPLTEELKWGKPCYTLDGTNVVLIVGFKEYCSLIFPKGALLKDPQGLLIKPGENTQAARQARFTSLPDVVKLAPAVKALIRSAIDAEKAGLEVTYKKTSEYVLPDELQTKFTENPAFKKAFESLTPGRQRAYLLHFSGAKQSKTRESRIEKCTPQILAGKGLND